ncbi:hypothetical protein PIROE2DRAFT_6387 [Piromyces sp. E2]|nr:hypothetical protein PIROE2DRAFT_6387 [Piromyces sp. E2]|eukprot:OUM66436.1 hypothetical protein PIROE2DRAFT_6387 [Piromyces sp. E2]
MKILFLLNTYINTIIQLSILIPKVYLFDIVIENTEEALLNLEKSFRTNTIYEEGVNIYFPEPYYDFSLYDIWEISLNVEHPLNCISTSANKTILNYGETKKYGLSFFYIFDTVQTVTFSGFIFINHASEVFAITTFVSNDIFHIVFDNCEFIDFKGPLLTIQMTGIKCILDTKDFYQVEFNNCKFLNMTPKNLGLIYTATTDITHYNDKFPKCITVKVSNSIFQKSKNLFNLERGNLYIDNCTFEEIDSIDILNYSIIISKNTNNHITIKNSIFKNNKINRNINFFNLYKANIE